MFELGVAMITEYRKHVDAQDAMAARRATTTRQGEGDATPREVIWRAEWPSPMANATTI